MFRFLTFLILVFVCLPAFAGAQSACTAETAGKSRTQLEQELEQCNREIAEWQTTLDKTRRESASFARDVAALTAKINVAQSNIKAKNIAISNLSKDIANKESTINVLNNRIETGRRAIADILRKTNEINSYSLVEAVLSGENISDFFADLDTYASTRGALDNLFAELRTTRALTEAEKATLNKKKEQESAAKAAIEAAKNEVERNQAEKKTLLAISQNNEKTYTQVLADREAKKRRIMAELFQLKDIAPIEFGDALRYAEAASRKTGVEPALILAILEQESDLGANVGTCNRPQDSKKWQSIMPGPLHYSNYVKNGNTCSGPNSPCSYRDDQSAFLRIIDEIDRYDSPEGVPLSCPWGAGWGGAMGPSQFIPDTWERFKPRIAGAVGVKTPDPWNPEHAIMATALYLRDLLAATSNPDPWINQRTAACRYYSGGNCYPRGDEVVAYGNNVMSRVAKIQGKIDFLQGV